MNSVILSDAISLAANAHRRQTDKAGEPYILHPLRVMEYAVQELQERGLNLNEESIRIVAVLHDVVEDTNITHEYLYRFGFSYEQLEAIKAITKLPGENYDNYIQRVIANPIATIVKLADINDNANPDRLSKLDVKSSNRLRDKYGRVYDIVLEALKR